MISAFHLRHHVRVYYGSFSARNNPPSLLMAAIYARTYHFKYRGGSDIQRWEHFSESCDLSPDHMWLIISITKSSTLHWTWRAVFFLPITALLTFLCRFNIIKSNMIQFTLLQSSAEWTNIAPKCSKEPGVRFFLYLIFSCRKCGGLWTRIFSLSRVFFTIGGKMSRRRARGKTFFLRKIRDQPKHTFSTMKSSSSRWRNFELLSSTFDSESILSRSGGDVHENDEEEKKVLYFIRIMDY